MNRTRGCPPPSDGKDDTALSCYLAWTTATCRATRMETPPLTRKPAPSTSRELVISRRWINSQGKWIALLLDFLIIPVMIVRVLELSGSLTSPLNATLLIPIGVMVWQFSSPRVHVNAQARRTRKLVQQRYLLGLKCGQRTPDIIPYTRVAVSLHGSQLSLELEAPGRPPLTLARANQYGWLTKRHFHSDIRTFMRMSREVAQILQIEDRGLHRHGKIFDRQARTAATAASGRTGG